MEMISHFLLYMSFIHMYTVYRCFGAISSFVAWFPSCRPYILIWRYGFCYDAAFAMTDVQRFFSNLIN